MIPTDAAVPDAGRVTPDAEAEAVAGMDAAVVTGCEPAVESSNWANWALPDPNAVATATAQSYDLVSDQVAVDRVTGLYWQRAFDPRDFTRDEAEAYCSCLTLGDYDDWRLPSRLELVSIVDQTRETPAIDSAAFPRVTSEGFWTASSPGGDRSLGYYVAFFDGNTHPRDASFNFRARCVRSEAVSDPPERYTISDETVLDNGTGLTWQRVLDGELRTWQDAQSYCDGLGLAGGGWRSPDMKELQTLIDERVEQPAIDGDAFPDTPPNSFWTGTPLTNKADNGWFVSFRTGIAYNALVAREYYTRCVR